MPDYVTKTDRCLSHYEAWPTALAEQVIHDDGIYWLTDDGEQIKLATAIVEVGRSVADDIVIFKILGRESDLSAILQGEENDEACDVCGLTYDDVGVLYPFFTESVEVSKINEETGEQYTELEPNLKLHGFC